MEELQKQFGDKIKILAVSNQDRVTLEKFFATKNGQRYKNVVSVAGDKMFHQALSTQRSSLYRLDKRRKTAQYHRWRTGYSKRPYRKY